MSNEKLEAGLTSHLTQELGLAQKQFIAARNDDSWESVIDDLKKAYYEIRKGKNHDWQGKEITDDYLCATYPRMKAHFANSQFWHDSKGRSYLDHVLIAAFVLGMECGIKQGEAQGKIELLNKVIGDLNLTKKLTRNSPQQSQNVRCC